MKKSLGLIIIGLFLLNLLLVFAEEPAIVPLPGMPEQSVPEGYSLFQQVLESNSSMSASVKVDSNEKLTTTVTGLAFERNPLEDTKYYGLKDVTITAEYKKETVSIFPSILAHCSFKVISIGSLATSYPELNNYDTYDASGGSHKDAQFIIYDNGNYILYISSQIKINTHEEFLDSGINCPELNSPSTEDKDIEFSVVKNPVSGGSVITKINDSSSIEEGVVLGVQTIESNGLTNTQVKKVTNYFLKLPQAKIIDVSDGTSDNNLSKDDEGIPTPIYVIVGVLILGGIIYYILMRLH